MPGIGKQKHISDLAQKLCSKTHFTFDECRSLLIMYESISAMGKVDRLRMREVLHTAFDLTDDVMLDRVYRVFDKDNDGLVNSTEWVEGISTLCRGNPLELINFCYSVYDINGDKSLAREELFHCLRGSLIPTTGVLNNDEIEEAVREIVEIGMKKLDVDRDQQITQLDFINACHKDPLLVQAIGPCLPPEKSLAAFMSTITDNYRSYSTAFNEKWKEAKRQWHRNSNRLSLDDNTTPTNSTHSSFDTKKRAKSIKNVTRRSRGKGHPLIPNLPHHLKKK